MTNRRRNEKIPAFFKVFIPDMSTNKLKIPSAFTSYMQGHLPKKAVLCDRNGKLWPVKLQKIENNFFFCEGWTKFVEDNSIQLGEFLVFQFDGSSVYEVTLFGHSCCEKNVLAKKQEENEEYANEVKEEWEEEKKEDKETNSVEEEEEQEDSCSNAIVSHEEEEEEEEQEYSRRNALVSYVGAKYVEGEETVRSAKRLVVGDPKSSQRGLKMFSRGKQVTGPLDEAGNEKAEAVKGVGHDIFKSGSIPQPKNPYFVTKIRPTRRDEVHVPVNLVKENNFSLPSEIILRDPDGREWTSKLIAWKDGRLWYCGGWGSLSNVNLVDKDDTYICEFVKEDGGGLFIQVHIVYSDDFAQNQK